MIFSNITDYNNTNDYLPIINGLIIIDILVVYLIINGILYSNLLRRWYITYKFAACFIDITTFLISLIIARYIYSLWVSQNNEYGFTYSLSIFIFIAIISQFLYDFVFAVIINNMSYGKNLIIDGFKKYANKYGILAFVFNSICMALVVLIASLCNNLSYNSNIILFICLINLYPYLLYTTE